MNSKNIQVEVVFAQQERQKIISLNVEEGCTVLAAVEQSAIQQLFSEIDLATAKMGVFGKAIAKPNVHVLQNGDRVEIYRPLLIDPKESRKARAAKAKESQAADNEP